MTLKHQELTRSHKKSDVVLKLDQSAAYLCMGKPDEAKNLLLSIEQKKHKNSTLKTVYVVNLIMALANLQLGNLARAQKQLQEVIQKGNKLALVQDAKQRLAEI